MLDEDRFVMYVIIRNDLDSMTPGRACAQATHAANHCVYSLINIDDMRGLREWQNETPQKFGTTIVLQADWLTILDVIDSINYMVGKHIKYGIVHDPEYHIQDGSVTHLIPLDTCAWIFGKKSDIKPYIEYLELY